jgi:hypothetical protein
MDSDEESPPSYHLCDRQGHLKEPGLASSPSKFIGGGDPLPTEGSSAYAADLLHYPSLPPRSELGHPYYPTTSLPAPSSEINVNTHVPWETAPFQSDPPLIPTRDSSWIFRANETGAFSATTVTYGDGHTATTSLGTRSINSTSSSQTSVTTRSGTYPTNMPPNHCGSIDPFSDNGGRLAPSDFGFRSARQGRRHTTVSPMTSNQVLSQRRTSKGNWCEECDIGFAQTQGLRRHVKDVHSPRQLCPLCDFKCSPGRKYMLRKHFEANHAGAALRNFCGDSARTREVPGVHRPLDSCPSSLKLLHSYRTPLSPLPIS